MAAKLATVDEHILAYAEGSGDIPGREPLPPPEPAKDCRMA